MREDLVIDRSSTGERVAEALRTLMFSGELAAGDVGLAAAVVRPDDDGVGRGAELV